MYNLELGPNWATGDKNDFDLQKGANCTQMVASSLLEKETNKHFFIPERCRRRLRRRRKRNSQTPRQEQPRASRFPIAPVAQSPSQTLPSEPQQSKGVFKAVARTYVHRPKGLQNPEDGHKHSKPHAVGVLHRRIRMCPPCI